MKTWKIPVTWEMSGFVKVNAATLDEAMEIARTDDTIPLPEKSCYVDGSFDLSMHETEYIRTCYNNGQTDEED